jgi:hypothetical protein
MMMVMMAETETVKGTPNSQPAPIPLQSTTFPLSTVAEVWQEGKEEIGGCKVIFSATIKTEDKGNKGGFE